MVLIPADLASSRTASARLFPLRKPSGRLSKIVLENKKVQMIPRQRRTRKKVVATASRRECVYKRTGEASVPFYEKGGTVKQVTDFLHKKIGTSATCSDVIAGAGFEPTTLRVVVPKMSCDATSVIATF